MAANLDNTLGVLYDSVLVSGTLYGAGCLQAWFYYRKYMEKDSWYLKTLVATLIVFDTCQQAILSACVYNYAITNHGDSTVLAKLLSTLIIEIFFSNFIAITVQHFYCYRIYRLSQNWIVTGLLSLIAWTSFIALTVYCVKALQFATFLELTTLKHLSMSCNILAAATDVFISGALIWYLRASKTGFKRSSNMINRLIVFTFNTGLPTSFCALMACVCISAWPETFWYMFFFLQLGRFYTNSFLVTLNSREYIRSASSAPGTESFSLSIPNGARGSSTAGQLPRFAPQQKDSEIAIRIETMKEEYEDEQATSRGSYHGGKPEAV